MNSGLKKLEIKEHRTYFTLEKVTNGLYFHGKFPHLYQEHCNRTALPLVTPHSLFTNMITYVLICIYLFVCLFCPATNHNGNILKSVAEQASTPRLKTTYMHAYKYTCGQTCKQEGRKHGKWNDDH